MVMNIYNQIIARATEAYEASRAAHETTQLLLHGRAMGLEEAAAIYLRARVDEDAAG